MRRFASAGWLVGIVFVLMHNFFVDLGFGSVGYTRLRLVITAVICVASRQGGCGMGWKRFLHRHVQI
jgi:hypothetical protein